MSLVESRHRYSFTQPDTIDFLNRYAERKVESAQDVGAQPMFDVVDVGSVLEPGAMSGNATNSLERGLIFRTITHPEAQQNDVTEQIWDGLKPATRATIAEEALTKGIISTRYIEGKYEPYRTPFQDVMRSRVQAGTPDSAEILALLRPQNAGLYAIDIGKQINQVLPVLRGAVADYRRQLVEGIVEPGIKLGSALYRFDLLRYRFQDPVTFDREWRKIKDPKRAPSEIWAYYNSSNHQAVFKLDRNLFPHLRRATKHELNHALSAASYRRDSNGVIGPIRVGLAASPRNDPYKSGRQTSLNEAVTEAIACDLEGLDPMVREASYFFERKLLEVILNHAYKTHPDIELEGLFSAAYFEQPQTANVGPRRWPARKELGATIAKIFRPGFLNQLTATVEREGAEATVERFIDNWQSITFRPPEHPETE